MKDLIEALLKDIGEFAGGTVQSVESTHPLISEAIVLRKRNQQRVLIANYSEQAQTVSLRGLGATRDIPLKPHGIARIDSAGE